MRPAATSSSKGAGPHGERSERAPAVSAGRVAVHATAYRAGLRYFGEWYRSVCAQSDSDFDVWISLDGVTERDVVAAVGQPAHVTWRAALPNATPSAVRQDALAAMVEGYDAIVGCDIDDVMLPSRIAAARRAVDEADVSGCALDVMDEAGRDMNVVFAPPRDLCLDTMLPRWNVFGFSNVVWRTDVLERCLPIPATCLLFDWLLTTRAWSLGARLAFDHTPQMRYRQYAGNTAAVLPPFTVEQVRLATSRVLAHYDLVLDSSWLLAEPYRTQVADARDRCRAFAAAVASPDRLASYVRALNSLPPRYIWWWSVANPELESLWKS